MHSKCEIIFLLSNCTVLQYCYSIIELTIVSLLYVLLCYIFGMIEQKGMTFYHGFGYSFPLFFSLLKKEGRRKSRMNSKNLILSHAFLLDLFIFILASFLYWSLFRSEKLFYRKVGRAITIWGAIERKLTIEQKGMNFNHNFCYCNLILLLKREKE